LQPFDLPKRRVTRSTLVLIYQNKAVLNGVYKGNLQPYDLPKRATRSTLALIYQSKAADLHSGGQG
jgi:hypothetical protein